MKYFFLTALFCSVNAFGLTQDEASFCNISFPENKMEWIEKQTEKALDGTPSIEYQVFTDLIGKLNTKIQSDVATFSTCESLESHFSAKVEEIFEITDSIENFQKDRSSALVVAP